MVVAFKMRAGQKMIHRIDLATVEDKLGRSFPWFVPGTPPDPDRHFAVCPYCENLIQIRALHRRTPDSPRPHGQHTGKPRPGFEFDALRQRYCPYILRKTTRPSDERRQFDPTAEKTIATAVSEFDRIILILQGDYGFPISEKLAEEMLRGWFGLRGYLYTGAHIRNVPWMVGYFGGSASLFGRKIGASHELATAITNNVRGAIIDGNQQLLRNGPWFDVKMQTLGHRAVIEDLILTETMHVRVQDFTTAREPSDAPVLHRFIITFDPERFEALCNTPPSRAKRNQRLLDIAKRVEEEYR